MGDVDISCMAMYGHIGSPVQKKYPKDKREGQVALTCKPIP